MDQIVIIGGGPGGLAAARAYRESGGRGQVTILTAEPYAPYRRPPLTKEYLRGEITREELPMQPSGWFEENDVDLRLDAQVFNIDRNREVVETGDGELPYTSCVLATGSEPIRIPVPGGDDPEILVMRTVENSTRLQNQVGAGSKAVVVGSGFIGCEAAASLAIRGAEVTLVSMEETPQGARLGDEVGQRIQAWLEGYAIELRLGLNVEEIERANGGFRVGVSGGESLATDAVLFGTGVQARTDLAEKAGLETSEGGVIADASMRTSAPGIFAAGDIAYAYNRAAGRHLKVEHWGDALEHGRVVGTVLAGGEASWAAAPGFWSTMGAETLKYAAWGDGWDEMRFVDHGGDAFTAWYAQEGVCVGVLTHNFDEDYEEGRKLVEGGASLPR